jgi:hypothetical protein
MKPVKATFLHCFGQYPTAILRMVEGGNIPRMAYRFERFLKVFPALGVPRNTYSSGIGARRTCLFDTIWCLTPRLGRWLDALLAPCVPTAPPGRACRVDILPVREWLGELRKVHEEGVDFISLLEPRAGTRIEAVIKIANILAALDSCEGMPALEMIVWDAQYHVEGLPA